MRFVMLYIRSIKSDDDFNRYMRCVDELNSSHTKQNNSEQMRRSLINRPSNIITYVITLNDNIVATATIILENKLRYVEPCCHLEDVGVHPDYRKNGYGRMIVEHCLSVAKSKKCYKIKLNCSDKNVGFYSKLGFVGSSNGMEKVLTKIV